VEDNPDNELLTLWPSKRIISEMKLLPIKSDSQL
jgi:hypothetical protein